MAGLLSLNSNQDKLESFAMMEKPFSKTRSTFHNRERYFYESIN